VRLGAGSSDGVRRIPGIVSHDSRFEGKQCRRALQTFRTDDNAPINSILPIYLD
jgi:hypothetical protein